MHSTEQNVRVCDTILASRKVISAAAIVIFQDSLGLQNLFNFCRHPFHQELVITVFIRYFSDSKAALKALANLHRRSPVPFLVSEVVPEVDIIIAYGY